MRTIALLMCLAAAALTLGTACTWDGRTGPNPPPTVEEEGIDACYRRGQYYDPARMVCVPTEADRCFPLGLKLDCDPGVVIDIYPESGE